MNGLIARFIADDSGATAVEYGLIAALLALAMIGGARAVGTRLSGTFTQVSGNLN